VKLLLALTLAPLALPSAVTYTCPSGQSFTVQLDKKATRAILTVPGRPKLTLPQSGPHYTDGFTILTLTAHRASLAAGALTLTNCENAATPSLTGPWTLTTLAGQPVSLPRPPHLDLQPDGASGFAGCNRLQINYSAAAPTLTFQNAALTRMACPPATMQLEQQFLNALEQTRSYQLNGPTLTLLNAANQPLATFTRK